MAGFYTGFGSTSSSLSSEAPSVPIFPIPYSFAPINPYTMFDPNFGMTGSYASNDIVNGTIITCQLCRKIGHGAKTCRILSSFGKGGYNGGNGGFARNIGGNGIGNTITCQLCKQIGHGAKICSSLSTFQQSNTLIGFPNQQQENLIGDASALIAAGYKGSIQVKKSSYQSLVSAPILPHSTTVHLPPSVILSSTSAPNPEISSSAKLAKRQYDQLHDRFLNLKSEKDAIQLVNQELNNKVMELQKIQESVMVQRSMECHIARERIQKLESEAEALVSKKIETEKLVSELELHIVSLSESSRSYENKMQDLLLKISALETENKDNAKKLQPEIWKKVEQIDSLLKEGETHEQHVDLMDKQVSQLHITQGENEQLIQQYKEREENLEEEITENQTLLTAAETRIVEDKKKNDLMLESKQLELSRHLKDISQRNDQAISDIQKKYEVEKLEVVNMENQKVEKRIGETERDDLFLFHRPKKKNLELQYVFKDSGTAVSTYDATHFGSLLQLCPNPNIVISAPA
ncbi:hypothetical protein M0R45_015817 [Rubus argutus]|uniref:CCHC-type domain-containing protein n=1 Tax=Rubus argutus TaxID=59490 RepID=A0AAW1XRP6_RUBAR